MKIIALILVHLFHAVGFLDHVDDVQPYNQNKDIDENASTACRACALANAINIMIGKRIKKPTDFAKASDGWVTVDSTFQKEFTASDGKVYVGEKGGCKREGVPSEPQLLQQMDSSIAKGIPMIIPVRKNETQSHWVTLIGFENNKYQILDPAGAKKMSVDEMYKIGTIGDNGKKCFGWVIFKQTGKTGSVIQSQATTTKQKPATSSKNIVQTAFGSRNALPTKNDKAFFTYAVRVVGVVDGKNGVHILDDVHDTLGGTNAGYGGTYITDIAIEPASGGISYCVHDLDGKWLSPASYYNWSDYKYGLAGDHKAIDDICVSSTVGTAQYRVKYLGEKDWTSWATGGCPGNGQADHVCVGSHKKKIERIQIKPK